MAEEIWLYSIAAGLIGLAALTAVVGRSLERRLQRRRMDERLSGPVWRFGAAGRGRERDGSGLSVAD